MIAWGPIFSSLKKNSLGALLIALEIAVTLAILANALHIIAQRTEILAESSGVAEDGLFTFQLTAPVRDEAAMAAERQADLAALRALPGLQSASSTNAIPLGWSGWSNGSAISLDEGARNQQTAIYFGDEALLETYGVKLIVGRNFNAGEVTDRGPNDNSWPATVIVNEALAKRLYDSAENALGKPIYLGDLESPTARASTIVGVSGSFRTPWRYWNNNWLDVVVIVPQRLLGPTRFIVRAAPEDVAGLMGQVEDTLLKLNRERVVEEPRRFSEVRQQFYLADQAMVTILATVIGLLALITAFGIYGMVAFWVTQRRRQIGTRRALGATRGDILRHFLAENALIVGIGILLGWALAIGLNLWLSSSFSMERLAFSWLWWGSLAALLVGQLATLKPARDAAGVPPVVATRA
jgi:putative ABC transport system permease protein